MSRSASSLSRELPIVVAVVGTLALVIAWLLTAPPSSLDVLPSLQTGDMAGGPLVPESARAEIEKREVVIPEWSEAIEGFDVEVFVVDERGMAAAGATVDVFAERIDVEMIRRRDAGESVDVALVPLMSAVTNTAGEVSFRGVPANARLVARLTDRVSLARFARDFASDGWGVISLAQGCVLNVQVVDRFDRPVGDAVVGVDFAKFEVELDEPWAFGARRTDEDGRVSLLIPAGAFGLSATVGAVGTEKAWVEVRDQLDVTLHVPGMATVAGVVLGRDHAAPIEGAMVHVALSARASRAGVSRVEFRRVVRSGSNGVFSVAVPVRGMYRFAVTADGWGTSVVRKLSMMRDENPRVIDVVLDPLTTISGTAVDWHGAPVTEGGVVATWVSDFALAFDVDRNADALTADLDGSGAFTLHDVEPSGIYTIVFEPPAARVSLSEAQRGSLIAEPGATGKVLVVPGEGLEIVTSSHTTSSPSYKMLPGTASLRLEVRSTSGELLDRVLLASESLDDGAWRNHRARRLSHAGDDGLHEVVGLTEDGTYRFTLIADGHTSFQTAECFPSPSSPIVRVDLPRASRITASVTRDGEPAPFASVTLAMRDVSRSWRPRRTSNLGQATFENLHPGVYTLVARQASATSELHEVTVVADDDIDIELPLDG